MRYIKRFLAFVGIPFSNSFREIRQSGTVANVEVSFKAFTVMQVNANLGICNRRRDKPTSAAVILFSFSCYRDITLLNICSYLRQQTKINFGISWTECYYPPWQIPQGCASAMQHFGTQNCPYKKHFI